MSIDSVLDLLQSLAIVILTWRTTQRGGSKSPRARSRQAEAPHHRRRATLSCPGHVTHHGDGTYDCTELADCPGPGVRHRGYTVCFCLEHRTRELTCDPGPNARQNDPL